MDEEFQSVLMKNIRFGKGKRFAHKTSKPLAHGVVEARNVSRLPALFANRTQRVPVVCAKMTEDIIVNYPSLKALGFKRNLELFRG